ncbi:hypothetical protein HN51_032658 [Arachis hypogaea]
MVKIAIKIAFVMIFFALVVTNGFDVPKIPRKVVPETKGCPGNCAYLQPYCDPLFPACLYGHCTCAKLSTIEEHHIAVDAEKQN